MNTTSTSARKGACVLAQLRMRPSTSTTSRPRAASPSPHNLRCSARCTRSSPRPRRCRICASASSRGPVHVRISARLLSHPRQGTLRRSSDMLRRMDSPHAASWSWGVADPTLIHAVRGVRDRTEVGHSSLAHRTIDRHLDETKVDEMSQGSGPAPKRQPGQSNADFNRRSDPNAKFIGEQSLRGYGPWEHKPSIVTAIRKWLKRRRAGRSADQSG